MEQVSQHLTARQAAEFTLCNPLEEDILENSLAALQAVNIQVAVKGRKVFLEIYFLEFTFNVHFENHFYPRQNNCGGDFVEFKCKKFKF